MYEMSCHRCPHAFCCRDLLSCSDHVCPRWRRRPTSSLRAKTLPFLWESLQPAQTPIGRQASYRPERYSCTAYRYLQWYSKASCIASRGIAVIISLYLQWKAGVGKCAWKVLQSSTFSSRDCRTVASFSRDFELDRCTALGIAISLWQWCYLRRTSLTQTRTAITMMCQTMKHTSTSGQLLETKTLSEHCRGKVP